MTARFLIPIFGLALALAGAGCNKPDELATPSSPPPPAGPVELKLKWVPGEQTVQEYNMDQTILYNDPGQPPMKEDINLGQKFSLTVVNARPDGSHELEMEFLGSRVAIKMGSININYDSDKGSASGITNPFAQMFARLIGGKVRYFLDTSNNVERIEGIDDLLYRASAGGPTGDFKNIFNEGYFKQMMSFNRFLPPNPVQRGDTWPVRIQFHMGPLGTLDMKYTLTFKGWEMLGKRNCARLEISGNVETESGGGPGPGSMTVTKGAVSGSLWFDPELGTTVSSKMNQDMTFLMTPHSMGPGPAPITTNQLNQIIDFKVDSLK